MQINRWMLLCKRARLCESIYMPSLCLCVCVSAACVRGWMWCLQRQKKKSCGLGVVRAVLCERAKTASWTCSMSFEHQARSFLEFLSKTKKTRVATALLAVKAPGSVRSEGSCHVPRPGHSPRRSRKYVCLVFFHNVNYGSSSPPPPAAWMNGSENAPHLAKSTLGAGENS